ncbi:hypothetical protein ABZ864_06060 [Streptomyces sp. NPDC047082]|uniref:hypothetical protein n=1 Tax=Streptomyces sp. NPDC047082 TaxID=3155259 RepID=UPI0033DA28DD
MEYTIIRVYRVPAGSQVQATNRFMEAVELGVEHDYLVRDYVKGPVGETNRISPLRSVSWWALVRRQLLGR